MFEEYLFDSHHFYAITEESISERDAVRNLRASIFYIASSLEAFVNFIGDSFKKGKNLSEFETAFLLDNKIVFDQKKFEKTTTIEYHRIEEKLRFLIKKFNCDFSFNSKEWSDFVDFRKFRDKLVHPRENNIEISLLEYKKQTRNGLFSTIKLMDAINLGIFNKPLRPKLIDLLPD